MKVGAGDNHRIRWVLLILLLPFFLLLSACPPPVTSQLATEATDNLPPTITVTSPKIGATYSASVTVTGTITDDALKAGDGKGVLRALDYSVANDILRKGKITIGTDGAATQDTTYGSGTISWDKSSSTFSFTISTISPTYLRGLATLIIEATDANGNKASSTVQLSEGSGPVITLDPVTKNNLKYTAGTTVFTLKGTVANASDDATHDDNIASIGWGVTGKNWGTTITVVSGTTSYGAQNVGLIPTSNFTFDTTTQTFSTTFTIPFINDTSLILTITATDKNQHTTVSTNYLVADISGPQMTFYSPTTNVFYSPSHYAPQSVNGNVLAAAPATLADLTFQLTTTTYQSDVIDVLATVDGSGNFQFPLFASGAKNATLQGQSGGAAVTITAVDSKGRPTVAQYNILMDNAAPVISNVTTTSNNATNALYAKAGDRITLAFQAVDALSGITVGSNNPTVTVMGPAATLTNLGGGNFSTPYTVQAGDSGPLAFSISATDAAGNPSAATTTVSSGVDVIIDNTAPTVSLSDNRGSTGYARQGSMTITATFTEANAIDDTINPPKITIGTFVTNAPMSKSTNKVWTYAWAVPTGNDGLVAGVTVTGEDLAGNQLTAQTGVTSYTIDNTKPDVALSDDQTDNMVKGNDVVNFTAVFTEANGISTSPAPKITIGTYGPFTMSVGGDNLHWTYQWTVPTGVDATEALSITATDVAGNPNTAATGSRLSYIIDNTKPSVVLSDSNGGVQTVKQGTLTITATFTEANGISTSPAPTISIGAFVTNATMSVGSDNLHWTYDWSAPSGNGASAPVTITATDVAGNSNTAATGRNTYTTDNTPSSITSLAYVGDNNSWLVTFDEGVYGNSLPAHSSPLATSSITFADTSTGGLTATVSGISHAAGSSTATYTIVWTGGSVGHNDVITATVAANSIYDAAGNVMSSGTSPTTGAAKLLSLFGIQTSPVVTSSRPTTIFGRAVNLIQSTFFGTVATGSSASAVAAQVASTDQPARAASFSRPDAFQKDFGTPVALSSMTMQASNTLIQPPTAGTAAASSAAPSAAAAQPAATRAAAPSFGAAAPATHVTAQLTLAGPGTAQGAATSPLAPWWLVIIAVFAMTLLGTGAWVGIRRFTKQRR